MKKCIWLLLGLVAAAAVQAAEDRAFSLASAGEVDAALVERVRAYLERNTGAAVQFASVLPMEPGQSLEALGRAAAGKLLGEADPGVIVLARPTSPQPQGVCLPHERFAVLNLARLEEGVDAAKLERRAGQEGLRVMSMLLDLSPCPFPLCVLVGYEKTEDLDQMSGNFCPPCQDRFTRRAREAGVRLIPPAPAESAAPADGPEAAADPVPASE